MEILHIVGVRPYSFTDEKSGEVKSGCSFYYTQEDDRVDGLITGKFSLSRDLLDTLDSVPSVGDDVTPYYNRYGKVSGIHIVK